MDFSIQQPTGRFLYGAIMAPIIAVAFSITFLLVYLWGELYFVFGIVGAVACVFVVISMLRLWRKNWYEYKMIKKSNPLPFSIADNMLKAYKYSKLEAFNAKDPIDIDLTQATIKEVKGGYSQVVRIENDEIKLTFDSSMKYQNVTYDEIKNELLKFA